MEPLVLPKTELTPEVELNALTGKFCISGESRPENPREFYGKIIQWLDNYGNLLNSMQKERGEKEIIFEFNFDFLNSISIKYTYDLFKKLEGLSKHANITINWHFDKDDIEMEQNGEEYSKLIKLPFKFSQR